MADMKKVLVADDEESMRLLLGRYLESIPALDVSLAEDSSAALKLAAERKYDLILLDLLMPGVGGIEVLTQVRKGSPNQKTPVIIVSVMADEETKNVCRSLGVADYVVKPVVRDAFLSSVRSHLSAAPSKA